MRNSSSLSFGLYSLIILLVYNSTSIAKSTVSEINIEQAHYFSCICDSLILTTSVTGTSYNWNTGDSLQSITVYAEGLYTCTITGGTAGFVIDTFDLVDCHGVSSFTVSNPSSTTFHFSNTSINCDSVLWTFGDGDSSTISSPTHLYSIPGPYNVCLYCYNYCETDEDCRDINQVSVEPVNKKMHFRIHPNPASNEIILKFDGGIKAQHQVEIISLTGMTVINQTYSISEAEAIINVSRFDGGVYFIRVTSGSSVITKKLVISTDQ